MNDPMVNIQINGITVSVPKGEMIIESARRIGVEIPYFCYHKRLGKEMAANCRMCLVEVGSVQPDGSVRMMPKPQTSCTLPATEGMVVYTDTPAVIKARRGIVEFLLINHPLDCPVCDRGGECPLQNNTLFFGAGASRYVEQKRHAAKAFPISDWVILDRERCIHCARCTRFSQEISGDAQLGFLKRGADTTISTAFDDVFTSRFSGNVIELCPVGALTNRQSRFGARPWDLKSQKSICANCSNGCSIWLDYRPQQLVRVLGRENEAVNEEWTCDKGKFGHTYVDSDDRLMAPLLRRGDRLEPASWDDTYRYLTDSLKRFAPSIGGIAGPRVSNEELYLFQRFFRTALRSNNVDHVGHNPHEASIMSAQARWMPTPIAEIENASAIVIVGSELLDEQSIVFLRVRKAALRRGVPVFVVGSSGDTTASYIPGAQRIGMDPGGLALWIRNLVDALRSGNNHEIGDLLRSRQRVVMLAGQELVGAADCIDPLLDLRHEIAHCPHPADINLMLSCASSHGAYDLGVTPEWLPGFRPVRDRAARAEAAKLWKVDSLPENSGLGLDRMLEFAGRGELTALYLLGADLAGSGRFKERARRALEHCDLVIVQDCRLTESARYADVVLPGSTVMEKSGSFTNCEGRIQRFWRCRSPLSPAGKADTQILIELSSWLGVPAPLFDEADILAEASVLNPGYASVYDPDAPREGVLPEQGRTR